MRCACNYPPRVLPPPSPLQPVMDTINNIVDKQCYRRLSAELNSPCAPPSASESASASSLGPTSTSTTSTASAAASASVGLQRSRSVRASFRLLGARWKSATPQLQTQQSPAPPPPPSHQPQQQQPISQLDAAAAALSSPYRQRANTTTTVLSVIPPPERQASARCAQLAASTGDLRYRHPIDAQYVPLCHADYDEPVNCHQQQQPPTPSAKQRFERQFLQYKGDHFGRTKKKKQLKRSGTIGGLRNAKENWLPPMDQVPANVPSKAAAILEIPVNAEQFNRTTSAWLLAGGSSSANSATASVASAPSGLGGHFKLLKRSVSLNEEANKSSGGGIGGKPRTATIRRGSVWANSTLSKNLCGSMWPWRKARACVCECVYVWKFGSIARTCARCLMTSAILVDVCASSPCTANNIRE